MIDPFVSATACFYEFQVQDTLGFASLSVYDREVLKGMLEDAGFAALGVCVHLSCVQTVWRKR